MADPTEITETPADRALDLQRIERHAELMKAYGSATSADVAQDIYFLSQILLFKQHLESIHLRGANAACICRTVSCGHRADQHKNGVCDICDHGICWC